MVRWRMSLSLSLVGVGSDLEESAWSVLRVVASDVFWIGSRRQLWHSEVGLY